MGGGDSFWPTLVVYLKVSVNVAVAAAIVAAVASCLVNVAVAAGAVFATCCNCWNYRHGSRQGNARRHLL